MVQIAAGERLTASKLSTTRLHAVCDTALTVSTTTSDISGLEHIFTTTRDNVVVNVVASCDCEALGTDTGVVVIDLDVDGAHETAQLIWSAGVNSAANDGVRSPAVQSWVVTLSTAGSHTIKLEALRIGGTAGDSRINATHSTLTAIVEDNV